jgi:nicotinate phosphoribosyltransferase
VSNSLQKTTIPGKKQVYRLEDKLERWIGDVISLREEKDDSLKEMHHPFDPLKKMEIESYKKIPLLEKVMEKGKRLYKKKSLDEIAQYSQKRLEQLPEEYKRFINPHIYKIGLSSKLYNLRENLIKKYKKN